MFIKNNSSYLCRFTTSLRYALLIACVFPLTALAIDPNSSAPIEIESDEATLNDKTGQSTYTGNVIISQGNTRLEADFIIVNSIDRRVTSIEATGAPAHFVQQNDAKDSSTHGYGNSISYNTKNESLTFTGNAKLLQAENSFSGEVIEYDVIKKAIKARGDESVGTRVKIQYYPNDTKQ